MTIEEHERLVTLGKAVTNLKIAVDALDEAYVAMDAIDLENTAIYDGARIIDVQDLKNLTAQLQELLAIERRQYRNKVYANAASVHAREGK